jgi:hypothetical protein
LNWSNKKAKFSFCSPRGRKRRASPASGRSWDPCCDFLNIYAKKFSKKLAFLTQKKARICKILIITLVFEKNSIFFAKNFLKLLKIETIAWTPAVRCTHFFNAENLISEEFYTVNIAIMTSTPGANPTRF